MASGAGVGLGVGSGVAVGRGVGVARGVDVGAGVGGSSEKPQAATAGSNAMSAAKRIKRMHISYNNGSRTCCEGED